MPPGGERRGLFRAAAVLVALGLAARALVPEYPGFFVVLSSAGLLALLFCGPARLKGRLLALFRPPALSRALAALRAALLLAALLLAGAAGRHLPACNVAGPPAAALEPAALELISRLEAPVELRASVSSPEREAWARHLMELYDRASPLITASVGRFETKAGPGPGEMSLAPPDSVVVASGSFQEEVSPIAQFSVNAALRRLTSPYRLVLNLMGDGEKSVLDQSAMGLSLWAESLQASKVYVRDCLWAGTELPPEALAAHALILAGPRRPLGEDRERALMGYLANGGKLLLFQDPLVVGFSARALAPIGLEAPWGLMVDPGAAWAATEDFFVVSRDFPAHPITVGLARPVVWPLAGAIVPVAAPRPSEAGDGPGRPEAPPSHTWSLARSSSSSWLETDPASVADRSHRYQAKIDLPGPLTLASATTLEGGGRLVLAADADLAANGFIVYAGNKGFLDRALYWLLGAQEELGAPAEAVWLDLSEAKARALFWIPAVIWPAAVVVAWLLWLLRRRGEEG